MRFLITLQSVNKPTIIPINYQYPLSAAIYKILQKADEEYAAFLHEKGYGKGFKLFTFSQVNCPFKIKMDRMWILSNEVSFEVAFHLPVAIENFVKGLFQTSEMSIADRISTGVFSVSSVESLPDSLKGHKDEEILRMNLRPLSPVVAGMPNEKGNYDFLEPRDEMFSNVIVHN